ncbi:MAG TPA: MOSC domain-containing protein [Solirubrobacteraceae bacterium]|nr:MOSC domain-containing protein [Solirubrobacteraceae bacterium]
MAVVSAITTTPVKGMRMLARDAVRIERDGVADNRCFYVVDARSRMVNGKQVRGLSAIVARYDAAAGTLELEFPDGSVAGGAVALGDWLDTRFFSSPRRAQLVGGPFSHALSEHFGQPLRLVRPELGAVDRGAAGAVSLIARASLARLEREAAGAVDARRFRMLVEVDGLDAHAEDRWVGSEVVIGEARVRMRGHVGRCLVTSQDPDTGAADLPTLELLRGYRDGLDTTEPLAFGIYGEVLAPGTVRVGDRVASAPLPG